MMADNSLRCDRVCCGNPSGIGNSTPPIRLGTIRKQQIVDWKSHIMRSVWRITV